jgi:hypothetical protein
MYSHNSKQIWAAETEDIHWYSLSLTSLSGLYIMPRLKRERERERESSRENCI